MSTKVDAQKTNAHTEEAHTRHTWLPEHSEAMSVMDSLCSSRISDRVILLPLLGISNTRIAPAETPGEREREIEGRLKSSVLCFEYTHDYISRCTHPHI